MEWKFLPTVGFEVRTFRLRNLPAKRCATSCFGNIEPGTFRLRSKIAKRFDTYLLWKYKLAGLFETRHGVVLGFWLNTGIETKTQHHTIPGL